MSKLTETIAIKLTLDDVRSIERVAEELNIKRSQALRKIIKSGLSVDAAFNQKMLIEILMILRSSVENDENLYNHILQNVDKAIEKLQKKD